MANDSSAAYPTGKYVKGDKTRQADTVSDAVQAVFDGYKYEASEADVEGGFAAVNSNEPTDVRKVDAGEQPDELGEPEDTESGSDESDPADPANSEPGETSDEETEGTQEPTDNGTDATEADTGEATSQETTDEAQFDAERPSVENAQPDSHA